MEKFDRKRFRKRARIPTKSHGLIVYYFGDGKGKTTAATGLAIRAHGSGMRVCVVQFMKTEKWRSYERVSLQKLGIPTHVLGSGFVGILDDQHPLSWHRQQARKALGFAQQLVCAEEYDVIVLDELVSCIEEGLLAQKDVLALIQAKPQRLHLVLTGHNAYPKIVKACDLVTKMSNIKHPYYTEGMTAQRGIDF